MDMRIAGIVNDSITDGPGLRLAVFAQGCTHGCKGCHNPHTHAVDGGEVISTESILEKAKNNPLLDGVTLTGGEPFLQADAMAEIARGAHQMGLNVIAFTGFVWEDLIQHADALRLLQHCDFVIDGKFDESLRSLDLEFKGSANQRLIDVKKSLSSGHTIVFENFEQARG